MDLLYVAGILFFIRNLIRWPRWLRSIHRRLVAGEDQTDPEKVRDLAKWMLLELLFACFWALGAEQLRSPELITARLSLVPLPLCFAVAVVLGGMLPTGIVSKRAAALDLNSTTDALKQSPFGRLVPEAAEELSGLPLYEKLGKYFRVDLPGGAVGTAIALLAIPFFVAVEGTAGYVGIHAAGRIEQHVPWVGGSDQQEDDPSPSLPQKSGAPSHEDDPCDGAVPGEPAPPPRREELYALWYGGDGVEGAGDDVAGCPLPAAREPGQPEVWLQQGRCDGVLEGLAISSPFGDPSMLLQQAAREGARLGEEGVLLSSSGRRRLGEGDLYVLQTTRGSYTMVRSRRSAGAFEGRATAEGCGRFRDRNVPYAVVPPGLAGIWRQILDSGWAWPEGGSSGEGAVGAFTFFSAATGKPMGHAHCATEISCRGSFEGRPLPYLPITEVSAEELLLLAEMP